MSEATITDEVTALMIERHPEWKGREWIQPGVSCLCTEHAVSAAAAVAGARDE
jgi:hypothetical protein